VAQELKHSESITTYIQKNNTEQVTGNKARKDSLLLPLFPVIFISSFLIRRRVNAPRSPPADAGGGAALSPFGAAELRGAQHGNRSCFSCCTGSWSPDTPNARQWHCGSNSRRVASGRG